MLPSDFAWVVCHEHRWAKRGERQSPPLKSADIHQRRGLAHIRDLEAAMMSYIPAPVERGSREEFRAPFFVFGNQSRYNSVKARQMHGLDRSACSQHRVKFRPQLSLCAFNEDSVEGYMPASPTLMKPSYLPKYRLQQTIKLGGDPHPYSAKTVNCGMQKRSST